MKTPKAEKLPSGNWRIKVQIDGKRYSCTASTKKEAQENAAKLYAGIQMEKRSPLTVGKAIDQYIVSKSNILSPSTIKAYKSIRKNYLQSIMDVNLTDLTSADITNALNADSVSGRSDKTLQNAYALLSATCRDFRPEFAPRPKFPHRTKKKEIRILTEKEMKKVWEAVAGTKYELPILLASWLGLRASEIKGLKFSDIQNGSLTIQRAMVYGEDGYSIKAPKTLAGNRILQVPEVIQTIIDQMPRKSEDEFIVKESPRTFYKVFVQTCKDLGIEPCRFHDLRHFMASEAHSLGIPDKYILGRMGHSSDNMLRTVYEHAMKDKVDQFSDVIDMHLTEMYKR